MTGFGLGNEPTDEPFNEPFGEPIDEPFREGFAEPQAGGGDAGPVDDGASLLGDPPEVPHELWARALEDAFDSATSLDNDAYADLVPDAQGSSIDDGHVDHASGLFFGDVGDGTTHDADLDGAELDDDLDDDPMFGLDDGDLDEDVVDDDTANDDVEPSDVAIDVDAAEGTRADDGAAVDEFGFSRGALADDPFAEPLDAWDGTDDFLSDDADNLGSDF